MHVSRSTLGRGGMVVVMGLALLSTGTMGVLAADADDEVTEIADMEFVVEGEEVVVGGADLDGPGVPDATIDERTYEVDDATVDIDGLTVTFDGETYDVCDVTIYVDDVSVTLQDVTLGDG